MRTIPLAPSSRDLVVSLLKYGDLDDVKLVLDRIAESEHRIDFWNHTELGRSVARRMEEISEGIPQFLNDIQSREEFWEYIDPDNRTDKSEDDLLPLKDRENRALYVRLAAYAIIGAARETDQELLIKLTTHSYSLIARTAAVRLVRLMGGETLTVLSAGIDDVIQSGESSSLAQALQAAELELYDVARLW